RSALVVNSLHDALKEAERDRDKMARIISTTDQGPPLFGKDDSPLHSQTRSPLQRWRDSLTAPERPSDGPGPQQPPHMLQRSLFAPSPDTHPSTTLTRGDRDNSVHGGQGQGQGHPPRVTPSGSGNEDRGREGGFFHSLPLAEGTSWGKRAVINGPGSLVFPLREVRDEDGGPGDGPEHAEGSNGGGGRGGAGAVPTGSDRGRGSTELGGRGGNGAIEGSGGVRGSGSKSGADGDVLRSSSESLEKVRSQVASLGAAVESSQARLLMELSKVQEEFLSFSSVLDPPEAVMGSLSSSSNMVTRADIFSPRAGAASISGSNTGLGRAMTLPTSTASPRFDLHQGTTSPPQEQRWGVV
ncbi:unnamed protein product, partial [Discosporangium mesarthrocarpum]